MLDLESPILLEGDISGALSVFGPGPDVCPEEWLLQNPGLLLNVLSAFRDAGADVLPAMTFGANVLSLSDYEMGAEAYRLNTRLAELTATAAPQVTVAGGLAPAGHPPEPFGPLPYTDLIDTYAEQALILRDAGVGLILIQGMESLCEARAAVLGARQSRLPILVTLTIHDSGMTSMSCDPLAALICLQELGISAFGLQCDDGPHALLEPLRRLAPYAKVPLIARPGLEGIAPEEVSCSCWELLAAGARILGGGRGATPDHMRALRILLDDFDYLSFPPPKPSEDPAVLLADEEDVYYIEEGAIYSPPIDCSAEISTHILNAEEANPDLLLFHLQNVQDAYNLGQNIHLAHTAVCLKADNEEALEIALLYYSGRASIHGESRVSRESLELLAQGYGAVVL